MRVGIIALLQETNTFISQPTTLREFEDNLLLTGEAIRQGLSETDHEIGGFFAGLDAAHCESVPLFVARALPFGTVADETYQTLLDRMLAALKTAGPLDGLLVAPHGATVSHSVRDVDGDWLSHVRQVVGPDLPIVSTADPHGNLSDRMVSAVHAILAYQTNPHIDQRARGIEATELLLRTVKGHASPTMAAVLPPMLMNIDRQCTDEEPCRSLFAHAETIRSRPGVLSCSIFLGFPYADVREMGSSVAVVTDNDSAWAQELASELATVMWQERARYTANLIDVENAVTQAMELEGPVCLLDMGDNVGGGSAADGTELARALHQRSVKSFVCLYDPQAVTLADEAGINRRLTLGVGGKTDAQHGSPLNAEFQVVSLHDGQFDEPEPRHGGMRHFDQGRTAVLRADSGLTVMLTSRRMVPFSLHQLTDFAVDPDSYQVLVAKGVNAPLAAYRPVCRHVIRVNTPGVTTADVHRLEYRHRRRPMFPFEKNTEWAPP